MHFSYWAILLKFYYKSNIEIRNQLRLKNKMRKKVYALHVKQKLYGGYYMSKFQKQVFRGLQKNFILHEANLKNIIWRYSSGGIWGKVSI